MVIVLVAIYLAGSQTGWELTVILMQPLSSGIVDVCQQICLLVHQNFLKEIL